MSSSKVVTRFAPSPTGLLHGGNYRTAVFSYLFARKQGGQFLLRIEDTDRARSKPEFEANIIDALAWLGLEYDDFSRQSTHFPRHRECLSFLIEHGFAYVSEEEAKDTPGVMRKIVRFKNPGTIVRWDDVIRQTITIDTKELGDFVIARSIDEPLFHLAVVVDDHDAHVTHIIRGEDHIPNTPRQLLLYDALGFERPTYAHLPLVLDASRAKLSKRRGARAITEYRDDGYLPDALLNFLALIGWNPGTPEEIFTREELIEAFSLERIGRGGAIFNEEKLNWVNKEHMKRLPMELCAREALPFIPTKITEGPQWNKSLYERAFPVLMERMSHFGDLKKMADDGELDLYAHTPIYPPESLLWKGEGTKEETRARISHVQELINNIDEKTFTSDIVKSSIWDYAESQGRGKVLWPMRYALSGKERSPDPFTLAAILGKEETCTRLSKAITLLTSS